MYTGTDNTSRIPLSQPAPQKRQIKMIVSAEKEEAELPVPKEPDSLAPNKQMNKIKKVFALILCTMTFFIVSAGAVYIPNGANVTATATTCLRKSTSTSSEKLGKMTAGMKRSVLSISKNDKWYKVKIKGQTGWVLASKTEYHNTSPYDLQTNYPNTPYVMANNQPAGATIATGACGPTSVGNVLRNACGIEEATTINMCKLAISSGARTYNGTEVSVLLAASSSKWKGAFKYYSASSSSLKSHIANGGMAIGLTYGGSGYSSIFSTNGHYVAIIGIDKNGDFLVSDPAWTKGKYSENTYRKKYLKMSSVRGIVSISPSIIPYALQEYYFITPTR